MLLLGADKSKLSSSEGASSLLNPAHFHKLNKFDILNTTTMKIFPLKQRDASACGPTSIQMVLTYFKLPISFKKIGEISQYKKRDGLSNKDLIETLQKFNLAVREKNNATWSELMLHNSPNKVIIVSWMKKGYIGHFSVVEKVEKNHITLVDPQEGKNIKIQKIVFMRLWMDYDDMWYPHKNSDIQLRWMCVVSKQGKKKARSE